MFSIAFQTDGVWVYARRRLDRLGAPLASHDNGTHVHLIDPERPRSDH